MRTLSLFSKIYLKPFVINVLAIVLVFNLALGGGYTRSRNSCFWGGWNKKAVAHTTKYGWTTWDVDKACYPMRDLIAEDYKTWRRGICSYQLSKLVHVGNGYHYPYLYGYVNARRCGRGTCYSDLYKEIIDKSDIDLGEEYEISELKGTPIIISRDKVKIDAITGKFTVKGKDVFSKAEIII